MEGLTTMSAYRTARLSSAALTAALLAALLLAACAPAATPTPTAAPTVAPTAEPTTVPTEEAAEPTEAVVEEEPTEVMADAEATDTAEEPEAEATEAGEASGETGNAASGEGMPGVVGVTSTRIRETPAVRGTVVMEISQGTEVLALGQTANEGYLFIRLEDGTEGWVSKQTINLEDRFASLPIIDPES
jgi:uncharacterized protein YgiM (DUF1202 family)